MFTSFNNVLYLDESLLLDVWNKKEGRIIPPRLRYLGMQDSFGRPIGFVLIIDDLINGRILL